MSASSPSTSGLVRHQHGEELAEPDGLVAEIGADELGTRRSRVPLVEDEVEDGEHRPEPLGQEVVGRDAERDPRAADPPLRAHEPLRHASGSATRNACAISPVVRPPTSRSVSATRLVRARARVAAREDEREPLVGDRAHVVLLGRAAPAAAR